VWEEANALVKAEPAAGGSESPAPSGPHAHLSLAEVKPLDASTLTADVVAAKIQSAYTAGLLRCYRTALAIDPDAKGSLVLAFVVNATGRTTVATATTFARSVEVCAHDQMTAWRFPVPKDSAGDATTARFTVTMSLSTRP